MKRLAKMDHAWSVSLYKWAQSRGATRKSARFFARVVVWLLAILAIAWYVAWDFTPALAMLFFIAPIAIGLIMNLTLGKLFVRKRPFLSHAFKPAINAFWLGGSFPSDHAMLAFAIATPFLFLDFWIGVLAITLAFFVALARVLVGVHYLSDIVVGALVGTLAACAVFGGFFLSLV